MFLRRTQDARPSDGMRFVRFRAILLYMPEPINGTVLPKFDPKDVEDFKILACFSYLGLLCVIPLFGARKSRFAQEHAKQGVILCVAWFVVALVSWVPIIGWLAVVVLALFNLLAIARCAHGEFWEIPALGKYREKIHV